MKHVTYHMDRTVLLYVVLKGRSEDLACEGRVVKAPALLRGFTATPLPTGVLSAGKFIRFSPHDGVGVTVTYRQVLVLGKTEETRACLAWLTLDPSDCPHLVVGPSDE